MEKLGKYLRENREAKGITLEEIEQVSNISPAYLQALEEGRFHHLPAPTFTIGFLKQYARCIGLDPEDVVLRYRTAVKKGTGPLREPSLEKTGRGNRRSVWILALTLLFLGLLWRVLYPGGGMIEERIRTIRMPRTSPKEISKERLKKELGLLEEVSPEDSSRPGRSVGAGGDDATGGEDPRGHSTAGPVEVILQALEETRVEVLLDAKPRYEKRLRKGERHALRADEKIKLQIENGTGVRIFYNGKVYEGLGKKGDVVHISFPPSRGG